MGFLTSLKNAHEIFFVYDAAISYDLYDLIAENVFPGLWNG
jgi:hypothetical protein